MSDKNVTTTEEKVVETKSNNKVVEVKASNVAKSKKKMEKKPSKIAKALKDTGNELKKVSWPKFKDIVKQTGIVLAFVLVFALVLFCFDRLCSLLTGLLF